jgi:radical SAM superfamily enzyme YgiQ (UPF0313 family)
LKILFVYSIRYSVLPEQPLLDLERIHLGLSCVAEALRAAGHTTKLVVVASDAPKRSWKSVRAQIAEFDPRVIAFTAVSTQFPFLRSLAARIKAEWPEKFLIIGGVHATLNPESVIEGPFDSVCVGEGEQPMVELATQLESKAGPSGIANLWLKHRDGSIERNAPRPFNEDLDAIPEPDRQMWLPWVQERNGAHQVLLLARGCPYHCTYCCSNALGKVTSGKYVRFRSPASVVRELSLLKQTFPSLEHVYLQAETIAVNPAWLQDLSRQIAAFNSSLDQPIRFTCNFRVARRFLTVSVFQALAAANVKTIEIGLESGSERLRRDVLRRPYSNEDFFEAVALARQHGMEVNVYNMIGLPGETLAEHWETIEANRKARPDRSNTCIFYPFPGTQLHDLCKCEGYIKGELDLSLDRDTAVLDYPTFSKREIQQCFEWFDFRIHKGIKPMHVRLRKVVRAKVNAYPLVNGAFMRLLPLWLKLVRR